MSLMRDKSALIERAFETDELSDDEFSELEKFMPPRSKKGPATDWRRMCAWWSVKFTLGPRGQVWADIPQNAAIREALRKAVEHGTFDAISAALPTLRVRRATWRRICDGARRRKA